METEGGCIQSTDNGRSEHFDYCCTPCSIDKENVEAINFCIECNEYFCASCVNNHNRFGKMKTHQILDKVNMTIRAPQRETPLPTEKCSLHHGTVIDTFCGTHDVICCKKCIPLSHRSCNIVGLQTAAKGIIKSAEYTGIRTSMHNIQLQLDKMKKAKQDALKTLNTEKHDGLTHIKEFRKRVAKRLDELEKIAIDELHAKHKQLLDKINADIKRLEEMLRSTEKTRRKLETATGHNESQLFVYVKNGKKTEHCGRKLLQELETGHNINSLAFRINKNIDDFLQSQKSLGNYHDDGQLEDKQFFSALLNGEYDVKVNTDKFTCDITGSCELTDGSILLADYKNSKLKRLDRSYQVRDSCDLPGKPFAVCASGPQEVVVTLFLAKKVQFISVEDKMTLTRSFSVECGCCQGVAYTNDKLFVSCFPNSLRVYNRSGTLLKTVQQNPKGQNMFSDLRHIALSSDNKKIHIADRDNGVITLGIHGEKQSQFTDPELRSAYGVCVGTNDEIFICEHDSDNIIQISRDGRKLGVVLGTKDGIKQPESLCWDRATSRLIVTEYDNDHIKVYDMKKK